MCFAGSIRDVLLMKNFDLISIIAALFAVMAVYNLAAGSFHLGFSGQPIAHSQHLWNILGMYVVGFAAVLAGGCPLRQLILAGQGSSDSAVTFLGMLLARRLRITSVWSVRRQRLRPRLRRRFPAAVGGRQDRRHRLHRRTVRHRRNQSAPKKSGSISRKRRKCNGKLC